MKKLACVSLFLCFCVSLALAMGGPAPKKPGAAGSAPGLAEKVFLIDDFESGSLKSPREWWTFDLETVEPASNKGLKGGEEAVVSSIGEYSLLLSGMARNWYAGGLGTYLAKENQDLSKYNYFQIDVYGSGPGSGAVKVELVDDDSNNWTVEQNPEKNYAVTRDDKFVYEIKVDWDGWKRLFVPLSDFVLENPGAGDGVWNPQMSDGSGGLLQMQFICLALAENGKVNIDLDNVSLTMDK
jgi:hypothetical protein